VLYIAFKEAIQDNNISKFKHIRFLKSEYKSNKKKILETRS